MKVQTRLLLVLIVLSSCAGNPASGGNPGGGASVAKNMPKTPTSGWLIRTEPVTRPAWVNSTPKSPMELFFVGMSAEMGTATEAREAARQNAATQVSRFYGQFLQENMSVGTRYAENAGVVLSDLTEVDSEIETFAQAVVTQINTDQYFTEVYRGDTGGEAYVVYALCQIPRQKAEEDIRNFSRDVSERYGNLLAAPDSLMTALNSYNHVLTNLEQNPLHRAVAYYEGRNGRVNLYDFLVTEMNAIANSVTFMPVSSSVKQNDEALDMTLRINSSYAKDIGPLDMTASVAGIDGTGGSYLISPQNTVSLHINTGSLQRGRYTALFELPLKELYPVLKTNPQGSYPFAITSVSAALVFQGSTLSAQQKNSIIEIVQQGIQRYNAPVRLLTNTSPGSVPYAIVVNYNFSRQPPKPPVPVDLYYCSISLALTRNNTVIHQAAAASFTEIESSRVFGMAVGTVRENRSFFQGIASSLDK